MRRASFWRFVARLAAGRIKKLTINSMEIKAPEVFEPHTLEFWEDMILGPVDYKLGETLEAVDSVLGVGDEPQNEDSN